jgi:predicted RND superfamily exporter protein
VVISALSTIFGFGSLATSHYPALRSTGYVAALGALTTCLVAVTLLPAYLRLRVNRLAAKAHGEGAAQRRAATSTTA